ncbi:MAG: bile acid:sodium symporter family protein [Alistipes sp.]|nr:bile acid:sodium symporter family protein [Alistipes sp.]
MNEILNTIDCLNINLKQESMLLVNIILAFVMFGVALGIKVQTFKDVFKNPKSVFLGISLQWVILPAITCLLAIVLNPFISPMIALGMILVASCPGGNISNFMSSLSKGNIELSVSLTAITTAFASFITPINFLVWGSIYGRFATVHNAIPTLEIPFSDMLHQILLILGLPIVLGILFAHYCPNAAKKISNPSQILSILLFVAMVAITVKKVLEQIPAGNTDIVIGIFVILAFVIIHNATALGAGFSVAKFAKCSPADCRTLTIETGIQNSGLGLALLFNPAIFSPLEWDHNGGMVLITALWGVWHIVSGLSVATIFRRTNIAK